MAERNWPLVSVITPTYNRAGDYLRETLDSVLAQDYANFEYIVLDDGSKDNTRDLLASYDDPRLRWESHENMGVVRTVNKAFGMARGAYVTVVNSDDPVLPGWLGKAVAFMETHPNVLAAYPDWSMIDENGREIERVQVYEYDRLNMIRWGHCFPGPGTLLRRRALELAGNYNAEFPAIFDYEFYLRLSKYGPLARIPEVLVTYRTHSGTISISTKGVAMAQEQIRLTDQVFADLELPEDIRARWREAYATAYYKACVKCWQNDLNLGRRYLLRSFLYSPFACKPNGQPRSTWLIRQVFTPVTLRKVQYKLRQLRKGLTA